MRRPGPHTSCLLEPHHHVLCLEAAGSPLSRWDCLALPTDDGGAGQAEAFRAFTTYKAKSVVLPKVAEERALFERMEPMALLALSCFCQRIFNSSDDEVSCACPTKAAVGSSQIPGTGTLRSACAQVKAGIDLSKFLDISGLLISLHRESDGQLTRVADMLYEVIHALTPVATDSTGFQVFVEEAQIAFIRAPVIKRWAAEGGAVRRRQEIPDEDMIVGRLPKGKLISLSHCWDATDNCDPTGEKMRDLAQALEDLDATGEEDGT